MQKSLSPDFVEAWQTVVVFASEAGKCSESLMSTLTSLCPFLIGNDMASKVSCPTPKGRLQALDVAASPEQDKSFPMTPVMSNWNVAPATSSSRDPVPSMVLLWPRVMVLGEKLWILTCVVASPQSSQESFKSVAETVADNAPATRPFMRVRSVTRSP